MTDTLVSVEEVRDLVTTPLDDARLAAVIEREEQVVIERYGAHYVDEDTAITETHAGEGEKNLYLRRAISSVEDVEEKSSLTADAETLTEGDDFYVWADEGRLERLYGTWGAVVAVEYVPADDSVKRKQAIIELVRLALERTAMRSENVAGEYSYQAPDWEAERARIVRNLGFWEV